MNKKLALGHVLTLLTMIIWGTTYVSTKLLLQHLGPVEILFSRFALAWVVLFVLAPRFSKPRSWREESLFALAGLSGVTLYFLIENTALVYTSASNVGMLIALAPMLTACLAHFTLKDERFRLPLLIGFALAIGGTFLVIYHGSVLLRLKPLGDALALLAALVWALYSILLKRIGQGLGIIVITRKIFGYGLLFMLPVLAFQGRAIDPGLWVQPAVLPHLLFLGLGASALCFVMWNKAVGLIGAVRASNYIYLVPVITASTAAVVLGERLMPMAMVGAVLILSGVYVSEHGASLLCAIRKRAGAEPALTEKGDA